MLGFLALTVVPIQFALAVPRTTTVYADSVVDSTRLNISTDTGDLAPGHRVFTQDTTILQCLAAANNEATYQRHSLASIRAAKLLQSNTPDQDTLPSRVMEVARACARRFSVSTTPVKDLQDLWKLELLARNDTVARATERRLLVLVSPGPARFDSLAGFVQGYLDQEPAREGIAESIIAQLVADGPAAQTALGIAYWTEMHYRWWGHEFWDEDRTRALAEQIISFSPKLQGDSNYSLDAGLFIDALQISWQLEMQFAFFQSPDSIPVIARRILARYQMSDVKTWYKTVSPRQQQGLRIFDDPSTLTASQVIAEFLPVRADSSLDDRLSVHADFWSVGPYGGDSLPPSSGVVSLVIHLNRFCTTVPDADNTLAEWCSVPMDNLIKFAQEFGPKGLKITVVVMTNGHAFFSGPQSPEKEDQTVASYFHNFLHLPITVAIQTTYLTRLPQPDGRLVEVVDTNVKMLAGNVKRYRSFGGDLLLIDEAVYLGSRRIIYQGCMSEGWEAHMQLIRALLQRTATLLYSQQNLLKP